MNINQLIKELQEAKEHCVDGKLVPIVYKKGMRHPIGTLSEVEYDNKSLIIAIEEL